MFLMKMVLMNVVFDESGVWWKWCLMKVVFDESGVWWKWCLMKVVWDESGLRWKWFEMKVVWDESGLRKSDDFITILMKLYLTIQRGPLWHERESEGSWHERSGKRGDGELHEQACNRPCEHLARCENPEINDEDDSKWPHNLRMSHANVPHLEKVCSNLRQQLKRKPEDRGPRCEYVDIGNVYDCHSASRSSSWKRIFGEFTCNQKSATTNSKTIVRCDKKVVQGSERNPRYFRNRLARKFLEKDNSVDWPSRSFFNSESRCILRFRVVHRERMEKKIDWFIVHPNVENWIEPTGRRRSSSGKKSKDSLHCSSSPRSRIWWLRYNCEPEQVPGRIIFMSMCNDIVWWIKETMNCDLGFSEPWQDIKKDSRTERGRFLGLDRRRNGAELTRANRMENGIVSLRTWCSTSVKVDIPYSVDQVLWNEELCEAKEKENCPYTSVVTNDTAEVVLRTIISVNQPSIPRAVADMCDELACRISGCAERTGKLVAQKTSDTMVMPTEASTTNRTPRTNDKVQGNLLHDYERKFANLPDHLQLIKLCSNVSITNTVAKGQYFTTLRCGTWQIERFMWRSHFTSRQRIQSKRMDPWEHEDRSSFGGGSQSPSRPLRNRDHDQLLIWRWNLFLGDDREWNKQTHDGNDGGNPRDPHRWYWRQYMETCCWSKTKTNINQRLRCHIICVSGLTWNQVRTTRVVSKCQKKKIRLLRHDPSVLREEDGAVEFRISAPMFRSEFTASQNWSIRTWLNYLQKRWS